MRKIALFMLVLMVLTVVVGCADKGSSQDDQATPNMAWQFAQGVVRQRVPRPSNATFPRYNASFVSHEDRSFTVSAHVNTTDSNGGIITYTFFVEAEYLGNDVFQEKSIELRKN